jgi:hypothetical protein
MIDETSRNIILAWAEKNALPHTLSLLISDHPEKEKFKNFARELSNITPIFQVNTYDRESPLPGFLIKENITYSALPLDKELPPFLEALSFIHDQKPQLSDETQGLLDKISIPCNIVLYIALHCPHCPKVVNTIIPLAVFSDKIHLQIIDGTLFPEAAQKNKVLSAPCLILDNDFTWTGAVSAEEILSMITQRDPSQLNAETLKNILEQGKADWIAQEMIQAGTIFKAFVQLILHETWSVRLGAMVVVETLGEKSPDLAAQLCPMLIQEFDGMKIPVQGDILYALGETGNLETIAWIQDMVKYFNHQDLKDAAEDAIEAIESRYGRPV